MRRNLLSVLLWISCIASGAAQCPIPATCTPGPASAPSAVLFGMGIFNVTLGSINNTTPGVADGYRDYACTLGTVLSPGLTYPISIQTNAAADENVRVWVDFNNDGTFNPATELFFSSNSARQHTGTSLPVPAGAVQNQPLRLRVAADASVSPVPTPCSTPQYSQVEDYRVTVQPNTQPPGAAFAVSTAQACAGTFAFQDQSTQGPTSWRWRFGDGTISTQQSPTHTYAQPGTYSVTLRTCNANGCDSLTRTDLVTFYPGGAPVAASCQPATTGYCCGYGITRFTFGGLSQTSADGSAGYEDFSCTRRLDVAQGAAVPVQLQTSANPQHTWIYLDANNDGVFSAAEKVFTALAQVNPQGYFVVPRTALLGQALRLRVISDDVNSLDDPCAARRQGQVEDYSLRVLSAPCPTVLQSGTITAFYNQGSTVTNPLATALVLTGQSPAATVQWQRASGQGTPVWRDIPGAVLPVYYRLLPYTGSIQDSLFRAVVSCGGTSLPSTNTHLERYFTRQGLHVSGCGTPTIQRVALAGTGLDQASTCSNALGPAYSLFDPTQPGQTATLVRGQSYQLSVTLSQAGRLGVFLPSEDGTNDPMTPLLVNAPAGTTTLTLTLDTVANPRLRYLDAIRLRVRCDRAAAGAPPMYSDQRLSSGGETEDYVLRLVSRPCVPIVTAGTVTAATPTVCQRSPASLQAQGYSPGAGLQWQTSADSLSWQDVAGQTGATFAPVVLAPTFFRVKVLGCATVEYSPGVRVGLRPFLECYCAAPNGSTAGQPVITRVRLTGTSLQNTSAATAGPLLATYAPTTPAHTGTVVRGATYALELDVHCPAAVPHLQVAAWLDLNRNGFYDSTEWVHLARLAAPPAGTTTLRLELPISTLAQPGLTGLRLRVAAVPDTVGLRGPHACAPPPGALGEAEEYQLTVEAAPCGATLTAGTIEWPMPVNCLKVLRSRDFTLGATLQWQRSTDGGNSWTDVAGATGEVYMLPFVNNAGTTAPRYRLRAQCGGATAYSPAVTDVAANCMDDCLSYRGGTWMSYAPAVRIDNVAIPGTTLANYGSGAQTTRYSYYTQTQDMAHTKADPIMPHLTTTLVRGQSYPLELTPNFGLYALYLNRTGGVWVDWNHDGQLSAAEQTMTIGPAAGYGPEPVTGTFTVPSNAVLGPTLLRVRVWYSNISGAQPACAYQPFTRLETEDYVVTIVDQPGPALPTLTATNPPGGPLTLLASGAGAGATYEWLGPNGFRASTATATVPTAATGVYVALATRNGQRIATSLQVPGGLITATPPARLAGALSVYPNPTSGLCTLRMPAGVRPERVVVRTLTGQLLLEQAVAARPGGAAVEVPLDLRGQPHGVYFVELHTTQGRTFAKVLVE